MQLHTHLMMSMTFASEVAITATKYGHAPKFNKAQIAEIINAQP